MEIPVSAIPLDDSEKKELAAYVDRLYQEGRRLSRESMWSNCYDAYNQVWRKKFRKEHSWIKNLSLYMQTMTQLVNTWQATLTQFLFPSDDDWISVEDEIVGTFWQEVLLHNFSKTSFIPVAHQCILQCAITGDNSIFLSQRGPYVHVNPVPVSEIYYAPLAQNLTQTSKVMRLRKTPFELKNSPIAYFNLDKLKDKPFWNYNQQEGQANHNTHNPVSGTNTTNLGSGNLLYQAYIHYFKFTTTKREIVNVIATIDAESKELIRFDTQNTIDPFNKNTWNPVPAGLFWGKGIVEPNLSPLSYMNSMATMSLVDRFLKILGTYTYNITDEYTHMQVLRKKMLIQPGAFIGVGPNANIQPLVKDNQSEGLSERQLLFLKNEMVETTGAFPSLSGSQDGTPDPTATQSGLRANAATGRAKVAADHWDETFIKPIAYRVIQMIHQQLSQTPVLGDGGVVLGYLPQPNMPLIMFWMRNIGWSDEEIQKKVSDPVFMNALLRPIEENQIRPTGTNTVTNRLALQNNFQAAVAGASQTPEAEHIDWSTIAEMRMQTFNVKNADEIVQTKDELLEEQIQELQQILANRVDPNTGLPFTNEQYNVLISQLSMLIHKRTGQIQPAPMLPPTPIPQGVVLNPQGQPVSSGGEQQQGGQ